MKLMEMSCTSLRIFIVKAKRTTAWLHVVANGTKKSTIDKICSSIFIFNFGFSTAQLNLIDRSCKQNAKNLHCYLVIYTLDLS